MKRPFDAAALVRAHQASVWRFLRLLGCDATEADDLTQETFLSVLRRPFVHQDERAAAAYLRQAARNLFLKSIRARRTAPEVLDPEEVDAAFVEFEGQDGGKTYMDALRECLDLTSGRMREALEMRYREKRSREAMAAAMGLSEDGIKSLLRRAREVLRVCMERRIGR